MGILNWKFYKTDIKSNGDFILDNNDLVLTESSIELMISIVRERYITAQNDLAYMPSYGSDVESLKGRGIDKALLNTIKFRLTHALTFDDFISEQDLTIMCVSRNNRVEIYTGIKYEGQDIQIKSVYFDDGSINVE